MYNIAEALRPLIAPIDSIKPDSHNARKHSERNLEALKKSLTEYGQRKPLVVNAKTKEIEAGNGLWQAAKELGWTEIAVIMVEDGQEMATGFALMDNQSALLAEWDLPTLKDILEELDTGAFDISITGFDNKEIEDLMTQFHVDEVEDTSQKVVSGKTNKCPKCGYEW